MLGYLVAYKEMKPEPKRLQALLDLLEPTCAKELKRMHNFSKKAQDPSCIATTFPSATKP